LALLYNAPRAASVITKTKCTLWKLDRETFNHIVKESAQKKRNNYIDFLKSVEILSNIDEYEKLQISDALKVAHFNKGEYIIREGEMGDVFYIVEEGEAIATKTFEPGKPAVEVKKYSRGGYFGELALIKGEPRAANVIAVTNVKLITLDRQSFKRLLGPIEPILQRNSESYQKYIK
jgi:cAMP-dependent protein kinase regulator